MAIKRSLAGILLCFVLALLALTIQQLPLWPWTLANGHHPIDSMMIALALGIALNPFLPQTLHLGSGLQFCSKKILYFAIILLGARLNLNVIASLPWQTLVIILLSVIGVFIFTILLARIFKIKNKTGLLIAIGSAICGSAAIVAAAPSISAEQDDIALSITTINLLGLLAIFIFPLIGHLLKLSQLTFGIWAGTSIQAVPQVLAAGFAYGHSAGLTSTVVKLVRVLLLAPMIVICSIWQARATKTQKIKLSWQQSLPPFIIFFFIMLLLNSAGLFRQINISGLTITPSQILIQLSNLLMTMALAAIGLSTSLKKLFNTGKMALVLALSSAAFLSLFSLFLIDQLA